MHGTAYEVFDWIESLTGMKNADETWASFMSFCGRFGFDVGALADMPGLDEKLGETILCTSWPDGWLQHYIDANYLRIDPTVTALMFTLEPYTWKQSLTFADYDKRSKRVFDEAADFGMHDGFVVPIVGIKSGTAVITVTGPASDISATERSAVHIAALRAHARIRELNPGKRAPLPPVKLSPREQQCIQWAAAGKTNWEISEILSISVNSTATHMKNIERKFGVTTRMQAVVQALVRRAVFL